MEIYFDFVILIELRLKHYFDEVEKNTPKKFTGKEENWEGVSYNYTFFRSPLSISGKKDEISFSINGKYGLDVSYCPKCVSVFSSENNCITPRINISCGLKNETYKKIEVDYGTLISIDKTYKLNASTTLKNINLTDPCEVTAFNFDVTSTIKEEFTKALKRLENQIDKQISSVDIKTPIEKIWDKLNKPLKIDNLGYLLLSPQALNVEQINFKQQIATIDVELELKPTVESTLTKKVSKLPKMTDLKNSNGLNLDIDVKANYDSINKLLKSQLINLTYNYKKHTIKIDSLKVIDAQQNQLLIQLNFSGSRNGIVYINAKPLLDKENQTIKLENLDFDVKSKSLLLKSAKWILKSKILDKIEPYTTIDISNQLIEVKKIINKELNQELSKAVFLIGDIQKIILTDLYLTQNEFLIRLNLKGKLAVEL